MIAPDNLDMGIWSDNGMHVWLPKTFYPSRNDAKKFANEELGHQWIDTRVCTRWMRPMEGPEELYEEADVNGEPGSFECWKVYS